MDKTTLVDTDLRAGRQMVERLESLGIAVDVAAWLQDDETGHWRLVLSSPSLTKSASTRMYDTVVSIVCKLDGTDLDLDSIRILSPHNGIISDLKERVRTNDDLQEISLDGLYLGGTSFRAARIYRVTRGQGTDNRIEYGARVRVKTTGQPGRVQGMIRTAEGPRYLVLYELTPDEMQPAGERPPSPSGQNYAANELEFLYVVRTVGWPERTPDWLTAATGASMLIGTTVSAPAEPR